MAFFASPAKLWLIRKLEKRNHPAVRRTRSQETLGQPLMGLPNDPERDVHEAVVEVRQEVEARRRRGGSVPMPSGEEMKGMVEEKIGRAL